jgi:hypothetical protein
MDNKSYSPHRQGHPTVIGGLLDLGGLAAMFDGLEPSGLLYLVRFAG